MKRLLERVYYVNNSCTKYISLILDQHLTPYVRIVSGKQEVILDQMQWFILLAFRKNIPDNKIHELGDSLHTLDLYCGKYPRITCDNVYVVLTRQEWDCMMQMGESGLSRQLIELSHLRNNLEQWRKECLESNSLATTMVADLEAMYDELMYQTQNEKQCIYYVH
jgi:hypothetical protein